jgi:uncharacterized RDD family membrane protein YckC
MTCSFCGARNSDGETRCRKCGRRPDDTLRDPYGSTRGALATMPKPELIAVEGPALNRPMPSTAVQRSLFPEQAPKIIPISFGAVREKVTKSRSSKTKVSRRVETQTELEFLAPVAGPKLLGTTVEAAIHCEAPVATRVHRAVAFVFDLSLILIGYGLFVLAYALGGGPVRADHATMMMVGAGLPLVAFTYGLIWAMAGRETCGQRWVHLRVLNFVGFPPEPKQRLERFIGTCVSVCACGLGLIWALADEESLTWQDHMSGTFLTPSHADARVFRRV